MVCVTSLCCACLSAHFPACCIDHLVSGVMCSGAHVLWCRLCALMSLMGCAATPHYACLSTHCPARCAAWCSARRTAQSAAHGYAHLRVALLIILPVVLLILLCSLLYLSADWAVDWLNALLCLLHRSLLCLFVHCTAHLLIVLLVARLMHVLSTHRFAHVHVRLVSWLLGSLLCSLLCSLLFLSADADHLPRCVAPVCPWLHLGLWCCVAPSGPSICSISSWVEWQFACFAFRGEGGLSGRVILMACLEPWVLPTLLTSLARWLSVLAVCPSVRGSQEWSLL